LRFTNGSNVRVSSPRPGSSILITVAPSSARIMLANGPASTRDKSRMVMCWSGFISIVFRRIGNALLPMK